MNRPQVAKQCMTAFTLVELLVVIGIIGVLLAIVLPVIHQVRVRANQTVCLSNTHSLAQAYATYLVNNHNKGPAFAFVKRTTSWYVDFHADLGVSERTYLCPALGDSAAGDFGGANTSWTLLLKGANGKLQRWRGSYGFNAWLTQWEPLGKGGDQYGGGPEFRHLTPASDDASTIPVFGDSSWTDSWPRADDPTPPNLTDGDRRHQGTLRAPHENMMARFTIARHGPAINISFMDGHAETVPLQNLKHLLWHKEFLFQEWSPSLPRR